MATPRSTMGADARPIHPALVKAALSAGSVHAEVQAIAEHLADLLRGIHGGDWDIMIDHQVQLVAISRDFNDRPATPKQEVA